MLSIERCRELLAPAGNDLANEQVEQLRDSLYELANLSIDSYLEKFNENKT